MSERVAILASGDRESGGGGSTANRVARDSIEGKVEFKIGVVICNNPEGSVGVYPLFGAINKEFGLKGDDHIDVINISSATHPRGAEERGQTLEESWAICRTLEERSIGFVTMLGYMKMLNGEFVSEWGWKPTYGLSNPSHNGIYFPKARAINNHPGILPFTADTHGRGTHEKAISLYRQRLIRNTAMTFHLASEDIDTGAIVYEEPVPIYDTDSAEWLGKRVQFVEKEITAPTIQRHLTLRAEHLRGHS